MQLHQEDFKEIKRDPLKSMKYNISLKIQPEVDVEQAIVLSFADMQFNVPQRIKKKIMKQQQIIHFGYGLPTESLWIAVKNWVKSRYCSTIIIDKTTTCFWQNMIRVLAGAIHACTKQGDKILCPVPTYYKFLADILEWKREPVQVQLETKDNRLYFNFQRLEQIFKNSQIKLFILANPWNPCGRLWSKQELTKLKDLLIKYKVYLFSDELFSDALEQSNQNSTNFTSTLIFEDLRPNLIYACSHSKAMNFSGMTATYSITQNLQLAQKMQKFQNVTGSSPCKVALSLLQLSYTDQQFNDWRINVNKYINQNYIIFKQQCQNKLPDLIIYDLQCSYLALLDFKAYKINFQKFEKYWTKINVCPNFMRSTFLDKRDTSLIRINFACNISIIYKFVDRLIQMVKLPWIDE